MTAWIQSFTGRKLEPLAFTAEQLHPADMAHHLALSCRFTGAVRSFYSVAEHSVRVASLLLDQPDGARLARYGILHDASEYVLHDLPRPLKRLPEFEFYRQLEAKVQGIIYAAHGLTDPEPPEVKHADLVLLNSERLELLGPAPDSWGELPPPLSGPQGMGWDPTYAEGMFLTFWRGMFGPKWPLPAPKPSAEGAP
jgi:hypothetical protein